ncbi:hypothetical protein Tco_0578574 [Tanacetum coccineum]
MVSHASSALNPLRFLPAACPCSESMHRREIHLDVVRTSRMRSVTGICSEITVMKNCPFPFQKVKILEVQGDGHGKGNPDHLVSSGVEKEGLKIIRVLSRLTLRYVLFLTRFDPLARDSSVKSPKRKIYRRPRLESIRAL